MYNHLEYIQLIVKTMFLRNMIIGWAALLLSALGRRL